LLESQSLQRRKCWRYVQDDVWVFNACCCISCSCHNYSYYYNRAWWTILVRLVPSVVMSRMQSTMERMQVNLICCVSATMFMD
jgi:hypothetical protein